ncbi:MAG TPA: protease modulator HflC [Candidatus Marinimicrobia bacterium]|jgi:membrane protease subunit HflC|nr:protease modulator HflC [Candidatus Neomarinimicrobiota bacterium]MDP6229091.1 protease modulator HflC [Candidatus Neomarinimicrobiota bacterium]MDP7095358.1 protease modulator HflC [Candidatus Neomarinimicrobiota bacterium]MDP7165292.1 protease modulator HflC [Candidatus Neomarinimicrobiota bacterium]MDP7512386.1 protease modulator HflC [Candidatus Neomarinimicrobiota bacterium]|tara:strand:- start:625 stop:1470 length:846 start_codon:yes stop_codon:yes gene_type:complete
MKKSLLVIIALGFIVFFTTVFIVDERQQVVVLQLGKPVRTITEPGLHFKLPVPFQNAVTFDDRLLEYDVAPEEILSKDKKTLIVDNYVRWLIKDPLLFLQTVQAIPNAVTRLDDIVYSELRQELGKHNMSEIITETREEIMEIVTNASDKATDQYGIEVVDVRIKRVDLPRENEESIYARMDAERKRQANKFRSEGEEEAQKIRASTEKDKTIILANAYKEAEEIRGEGEAKALEIYANAFNKDPEFYEFMRTLEAYKKVIDKKTTLVLPADSKLFKTLNE